MQSRNPLRRNALLARWGDVPNIKRFFTYVQLDIRTRCWLWIGSLNSHGYGQFHDSDRKTTNIHAFRWAYEYFKGQVPEGFEPDHLCRIRSCVNPDHLEAVAHSVNCARGASPWGINARKTYCNHGHSEWSKAGRNGGRRCLACHRENEKARLQRRRAEVMKGEDE